MTTNTDRNEICSGCGGNVLPVMYGMPGEDAMKAAERGEMFLGGCMIEDVAFRCDCGATTYLFDNTSAELFGIGEALAGRLTDTALPPHLPRDRRLGLLDDGRPG